MFELCTNITGIADVLVCNNTYMDGWFGNVLVIMIFSVTFLMMKYYASEVAFAYASIFTAVMTIMLRAIGIVGNWVLMLTVILAALSIVALYRNKNP